MIGTFYLSDLNFHNTLMYCVFSYPGTSDGEAWTPPSVALPYGGHVGIFHCHDDLP